MIDSYSEEKLRQCIEAFYFAYRTFTEKPDEILEQRGLNRAHHRILYFVGRHPGIRVGELLDILAISKQALNAPLRQLVGMGLVESNSSDSDRRSRELTLSGAGRELEKQLTREQLTLLSSAALECGDSAFQEWTRIMGAIARQ